MEFLLLSLKSGCMIAIRALTGMQLMKHEEKCWGDKQEFFLQQF